jgi:hypothetical protein
VQQSLVASYRRLLDPPVRVATSTPGADPSGDYAWQLFDKPDDSRSELRRASWLRAHADRIRRFELTRPPPHVVAQRIPV